MSSKKKSKPSFEVPAVVDSGGESGWVYRSDEEALAEAESPGTPPETSMEILLEEVEERVLATREDAGASLALAMAAMAQVISLGVIVMTIPFAMTLRAIESLNDRD